MGDPKDKSIDQENREWLESADFIYKSGGPKRLRELLRLLQVRAQELGVSVACPGTTPYINTIPYSQQPPYPGNRDIERRLKSLIRWNAMAMVVRANRTEAGIGGHISTYASQATLFEVAFNHFIRGKDHESGGDICYFQGHAAPGIYARAYLEGRLREEQLANFRRELKKGGGLPSYPHPWLFPTFWEYPTVSMGLGPIMAIYQARFNHYLADRKILDTSRQKIWAFMGDGEMDEPESMGALTLASREGLDNLIFVVNCNLQRLDGPVRGNGQIIQELESAFRGAGWRVIKVLWGDDWDPLFERDETGLLVRLLEETPDGALQKFSTVDGAYIREHFFGKHPELLKLVEHLSDEQLAKLRRGGHDPDKVYAAFDRAVKSMGAPTVVLALTIKGYGLGEAGEGRNITHQQKKLNEEELRHFRNRFDIPIADECLADACFYKPEDDTEEMKYLRERRAKLGGFLPERRVKEADFSPPPKSVFTEFFKGSEDREMATTMAMVRIMGVLLQDKNMGKRVVPIVPDEARTFGMEALFRQYGIYSSRGQVYEPVDRESLLFYNEKTDGVILEEGITEAGAISSFIAAGTSYASHGLAMVPFFFYYSMFGFQRIGDLIWAAADSMAKGFLIGATAGRTTLAGEGLQHQDGHSHHLAYAVPNLRAYDPAFAYELAVIVRDGLERMYVKGENVFYYLTVTNEFYSQPPMPEGVEDGIVKGLYKFRSSSRTPKRARAHLLASGAIFREALTAAKTLEEDYDVPTDVWSVTSYKELYRDAVECDRRSRLRAPEKRTPSYVERCFRDEEGVVVAVSDYMKTLPASLAQWIRKPLAVLGTDGFGRSDTRAALRSFFEVDARHIAFAALVRLAESGMIDPNRVTEARKKLEIDPEKPDPVQS
ncbi:MAG: pyruvate dehydrogenase (acetyl-transferring), homodimeric type [Spirochaetales bacterium]|nr:pyruvate dehydrogenase (acetyl-transferring), homodimeric type [Spirochaetales bacterium]